MKRFLIIICSFIAFLVFCSKSCETPEDQQADKEEAVFKATLDSINSSFSSDQPSEQSLRSLEVKAKQKLTDLADYLQIYADKSLDEAFREHARQMILDLFISDSVRILLKVKDGMSDKSISLKDFLQSGSGPSGKILNLTFDSIILSEPLHRINEILYLGNLRFSQRYEIPSASNLEISCSVKKEVNIIATKIRKQFGRDTLQIWQVYLGDIR